MTPKAIGIHTRAMLVKMTLSLWEARKLDKKITADTNAKYAASADAGRYNKHLFGGPVESHSAVISAGNALRQLHYRNTLPWRDDSWRLLTTANYQPYVDATRKQIGETNKLLDVFLSEYPRLQRQAETRLNGMFDPADYPTEKEIRRKFDVAIEFDTLSAGSGDVRLDLPADALQAVETSVRESFERALDASMKDAAARLFSAAYKIVEKLSDPKAIYRDTLIENARELCDVLPRLNVTNDQTLNDHIAELAKVISGVRADDLRVDPRSAPGAQKRSKQARKHVADDVRKIVDSMKDVYGDLMGVPDAN